MARAIDSEKYMELLKEQYLHYKAMKHGEAARAWQGAIQLLYDMPTLSPQWISVEARLPEDEAPVLDYYGFFRENDDLGARFIGTLTFFVFDKNPHWQHESTGLFVTHWMPLPEPPKEE